MAATNFLVDFFTNKFRVIENIPSTLGLFSDRMSNVSCDMEKGCIDINEQQIAQSSHLIHQVCR